MFRRKSGQEDLMPLVGWPLTVRQERTDELPFEDYGTGRSHYPADKVSIAVPSRSVRRS